jgi:hypothetical protein
MASATHALTSDYEPEPEAWVSESEVANDTVRKDRSSWAPQAASNNAASRLKDVVFTGTGEFVFIDSDTLTQLNMHRMVVHPSTVVGANINVTRTIMLSGHINADHLLRTYYSQTAPPEPAPVSVQTHPNRQWPFWAVEPQLVQRFMAEAGIEKQVIEIAEALSKAFGRLPPSVSVQCDPEEGRPHIAVRMPTTLDIETAYKRYDAFLEWCWSRNQDLDGIVVDLEMV